MTATAIHDLDELVLRVRDPESRLLFAEAVQAYRGGALRSAVTSTWIAVVYDVLAKIRELAVGGDKNATGHVERLDTAVASNDIPTLQKIETSILEAAADEFELLAAQEKEDLKRLQADRNLCAHPALVADHSIFQPTPELVRTHLVHAALHLLRHPPVQGKSALARITAEMARPSFPDDAERAFVILSDRLGRAKEALVRNLTIVLLKTLFFGADAALATRPTVVLSGLMAIARIHSSVYEREVRSALAKWIDAMKDEQMAAVFRLTGADPRCWGWLSEPARIRALEIVSKQPPGTLAKAGVFDALHVTDVRAHLLERFAALDSYEKQSVIAENPRPEFAEEALTLFSQAGSYRGAESLGRALLLPMAPFFSSDQVRRAVLAARDNGEIWDAAGTPAILERFFELTLGRLGETAEVWREFMRAMAEKDRASNYSGIQQRLARHKF